ncbi:hypothetical protein [Limosilactobacillus fermentum]|uniref:hypothetical protein n=1 Tax=Limosilactobacillus fermentum TaxID=1613 RepID=UPI0019636787|nr:hypothetical protein [Limosilactobacillus fermentum]MBM9561365.1 hypothetical protein [Limosilactobacillus fermentum]
MESFEQVKEQLGKPDSIFHLKKVNGTGTVPCQVDTLNNKNWLALPKRYSAAVRSFLLPEIKECVK